MRLTYRDVLRPLRAGSPRRWRRRGIGKGDTVSVMLANTPAMLECHYGVPMTGAVLNTLNTRLDAAIIAFSLDHAEAKVLIIDREFCEDHAGRRSTHGRRRSRSSSTTTTRSSHGAGERLGEIDYEAFHRRGRSGLRLARCRTTNGTRSRSTTPPARPAIPKGVVYHHRGAYLIAHRQRRRPAACGKHPVYLWTLPMFHCNGWCFPWTISVVAGTHVCLRWVRAEAIYDALAEHKVTHLCGAPIVMSTLLNAPDEEKRPLAPHGRSSSPRPRRRPKRCSRPWPKPASTSPISTA